VTPSVDYDAVAATFDRRYERADYRGVAQAVRRFVVLEVGCGTGHWLAELARDDIPSVGLDPSIGMLTRARVTVPQAKLVAGRAESLPWATAVFHRILCVNTIHHVTEPRQFFAEAHRVLRSDGAIMVVGLDPHVGLDSWWIYDYFDGALERDRSHYPSTGHLRAWMETVGFNNCTTAEVQHWRARMTAGEAITAGYLDKAATSQLSILTDEEYAVGMQRISRDRRRTEGQDAELCLAADLRLYATVGRV
jgi:SAM-dependent methyltransferase